MSWNLFFVTTGDVLAAVHIAPSDERGVLDAGHVLEPGCECKPTPETRDDGVPLLVHRRFAGRRA